jgi:hypothetical protein
MKVIASFYWDCGRMGSVESIFVCDKEKLDAAIGKEVYFGEILGKHSEIFGKLEANEFKIKSEDQEFIAIMGDGTISGHNPLDYLEDQEQY